MRSLLVSCCLLVSAGTFVVWKSWWSEGAAFSLPLREMAAVITVVI